MQSKTKEPVKGHQPIKQTEFNGVRQISVQDIRNAIPEWCFKKNEARFMVSVFFSASLLLTLGYLAHQFLPLSLWALPIWVLYAVTSGTAMMGFWVLGHECGHGAFSNNKYLNDILGFIIHTLVLVPYFSWQWSHFVHHSQNSHITQGESHIPLIKGTKHAETYYQMREIIGVEAFAIFQVFVFLLFGFPLYFLIGISNGHARGFTSHVFVPNQLFPRDKVPQVMLSNIGIITFLYLLYVWSKHTSFTYVFAIYGAPYLVVNAWLVLITWLHHTDEAVQLYDDNSWTWLKGALGTIDRNYPQFINALQFDIGSTHVTHHIFSDIPHYNVGVANQYVQEILGPLYIRDQQSFGQAVFKTATYAGARHIGGGVYEYD